MKEMQNPNQHPNKEIREALNYATQQGWTIRGAGSSSHAWGMIYCPENNSDCRGGQFCITSIWNTPKNPSNHAKQIRRVVDNCNQENSKDLGEN